MKLILKGNPRYIKHMFKHLKAEHPSVRRRISLQGGKRK